MRATTNTYKQLIATNNTRNYLVKINMTLADDTELELTNEDIWSDSFELETASSNTASFDVGCAVIGKCKFQLNNFDERFNSYDFFNATAVVWLKLDGDSSYYRIGVFTVDEPSFAGALISLELLDNMWKFDVPLSEVNLTYPVTILSAVNSICSYCGVTLATQDFHGKSFQVGEPKDDMNCREFLQYVAMIGCNFCIMDSQGNLNIKWYNTSAIPSESDLDGGTFNTNTTPYSDGDTADGGNFLDYTSGDSYDGGTFTDNPDVAYFTRNYSTTLGTDVITITGLKVTIDKTEYTVGSEGYVLEIDNPLITVDNVSSVLNLMWEVLEGFSFRTFSVDALSDLAVEVGDCCAVMDLHGNYAYSFVTNLSYKLTSMTASLGAVSPTRTLTKRYSKTVQQAVDQARKQTDAIISDYDLSVQMMNALSVISMGAYRDYEDVQTGGRIYYLSNMPITKTGGTCSFEPNSTVFKISGDGFFVSTQGGQAGTWNNGYDPVTGQLVVNVLYAIGLSASWIKTGTLTVGGSGTNAVIEVKDSGDHTIATVDLNGITMYKGLIRGANGKNWFDLTNDEFKFSGDAKIYGATTDYSGAYVPTNSNAPASSWNTDDLKRVHVGNTFLDTDTDTPYVYSVTIVPPIRESTHPTENYVDEYYVFETNLSSARIVFNTQCELETNTDYIDLFYTTGTYYYKKRLTGDFGDEVVKVPNGKFWLHYHTDSSINNWGWKIDSIQLSDGSGGSGWEWYGESLPEAEWVDSNGGKDYKWVESTLENYIQVSTNEILEENLTQDEIFDILTDGGQEQGIFLQTNKIYLNASYMKTGIMDARLIRAGYMSANIIHGGSLVLGGTNNYNGRVFVLGTNSALQSYSDVTLATQYFGYSQAGALKKYGISVTVNGMAQDVPVLYRVYETTDGSNFTLIEEGTFTTLSTTYVHTFSTIFDIDTTSGDHYYQIDIQDSDNVTFDCAFTYAPINTLIDETGILSNAGKIGLLHIDTDGSLYYYGDKYIGTKTLKKITTSNKSYNTSFYIRPKRLGIFSDFQLGLHVTGKNSRSIDVKLYLGSQTIESHTLEYDPNYSQEYDYTMWFDALLDKDVGDTDYYKLSFESSAETGRVNQTIEFFTEDVIVSMMNADGYNGSFYGALTGQVNSTIGNIAGFSYNGNNGSLSYSNGYSHVDVAAGKFATLDTQGSGVVQDIYSTTSGSVNCTTLYGISSEHRVTNDTYQEYDDELTPTSGLPSISNNSIVTKVYSSSLDTDIFKTVSGTTEKARWQSASDIRLKEDITDLDTELSRQIIESVEPKRFKYKAKDGIHYGMIAQEVRKVLDDLGETDAQLEFSQGEMNGLDEQRAINYEELVPHLINYVRELKAEINKLKEG